MKIVHKIDEVRSEVNKWRSQGLSVGLVPTMGYLHQGHISLMEAAKKDNDKVVVSIFVNPMQFGANEDLASYPRDMERDSHLAEEAGIDLIFSPNPEEMYGSGFCSFVDMTGLTEILCGKSRPVMFRGVCTVVSKLFNIVTPDRAYFGQKDAQQLSVICRMVKDLNFPIEIVGCPIIREKDGLAKSSRNVYLTAEERKAALILNKSLKQASVRIAEGERNAAILKEEVENLISSEPLAKIDYVEILDWETLKPIEKIKDSALVAVAVYFGKARLIDNYIYIPN